MRSEAPLATVGLVCLLTMFVTSGIHKVRAFDATVGSVQKKLPALPLPRAVVVLVILLEILAPLVVLGTRFLAPPLKGHLIQPDSSEARQLHVLFAAGAVAVQRVDHSLDRLDHRATTRRRLADGPRQGLDLQVIVAPPPAGVDDAPAPLIVAAAQQPLLLPVDSFFSPPLE